jgi:hypothetical protein
MRDNQTHSAISRKTTDAYSNQAIDGGYEDLINSGNSCLLMIAYASLQYFASAQTGDGVPSSNLWNPIKIIAHFICQS